MDEILLAIQAIIKANVPEIRMVDVDLGQLEETEPPVSYPCVLVGFDGTIDFAYLSQNIQEGDTPVSIKIGFKVLGKTHNVVTLQALEHYSIVKKISQYLNATQGTCFTRLNRISQRQIKRRDLRVFELLFNTVLTEDLTLPENQYTPWNQIPGNTTAALPELQIITDIQPAPNTLNTNTIGFNDYQNYTEVLAIEELTLDGTLYEVS
jgi:hypothetical protein